MIKKMADPEIVFAVLAIVFAVGWFVQKNFIKKSKNYSPRPDDDKEKDVNMVTKCDTKCSKLNAALNNAKYS